MKMKKILSSILAAAMVLSTMSQVAFAEADPATHVSTGGSVTINAGETKYASLTEAAENAVSVDGTVTYYIDGNVEYVTGTELSVDGADVVIEGASGADSDSVTLTTSYCNGFKVSGDNLTIKNITLHDLSDQSNTESALTAWEWMYITFNFRHTALNITCEGVTFTEGVMVDGAHTATFTGCNFDVQPDKWAKSKYSLWVSTSGKVEVIDNDFNGVRGIKVDDYYGDNAVELVVEENTFNNLSQKPAINWSNNNGGSLEMNDNTVLTETYGKGILAVEAPVKLTGTDLADMKAAVTVDGETTYYATVEEAKADAGSATVEKIVAEVKGTLYTSVAAAVDAAKKGDTIVIYDDLQALAPIVNGGQSLSGITVELANDIDLKNAEWTPIGKSGATFQGTFDGKNHTISNLNVNMPGTSYVGLFGYTTNGEVKNLTVENATVKGRLGVGVIAGSPYTSDMTNLTLKGDIVVEGMAYVGGMLGRNFYATGTDLTVDANEGSYVKADSWEDGTAYRTYVGGIVGFMGEGNHGIVNATSNIDVIGTVIDAGGITGIAHYNNKFVNCHVSGNVSITNSDEDVMEIGGIAGTVHNQPGTSVTFENNTFTGELSFTSVNGTYQGEFPNGGLYGAFYKPNEPATVNVAKIGTEYFTTLPAAFEAVEAGETIELLGNIVITEQITVTNPAALGGTVTLDGNGYSILAGNLGDSQSPLYFGVSGNPCAGITIKDLTVNAEYARFGLMFYGGNLNTLTNVTVTGDYYYYGINLFGTAGATMTDCNVVSLFTNGQDDNPLKLINTNINKLFANKSDLAVDKTKVFIDNDSYVEELTIWGTSTHMIDSLENVGSVKDSEGNPMVAKIGNVHYTSFEAALSAAADGDVIDLMGNTHKLDNTNKKIADKELTIENGTFDISNTTWGGNSIFDIRAASEVTMNNVNFVGTNYSSAYGVIYAYDGSVVTLNNCNFDLNAEDFAAGGVLKGNGSANSKFIVNNCTFDLINPVSVIKNTTLEMTNTTIQAEILENGIVNNAFREIVGTITDSTIYVKGFENGIKNDSVGGPLTINGNSIVKLLDCHVGELDAAGNLVKPGFDLAMTDGSVLTIEDEAKVYADVVATDSSVADTTGKGFVSMANTIVVDFEPVESEEGEKLYNINLVGADNETINRLNSADLTFVFTATPVEDGDMDYEIIAVDDIAITTYDENRYMFNFEGKDDVEDTANSIRIAQVKVSGYGTFSFAVADSKYNEVHATKMQDNIVDTFIPNGDINAGEGKLDIAPDADITDVVNAVPTRELKINISFPNAIMYNDADYQDMTVTIVGGNVNEEIELGEEDTYTIVRNLPVNTTYTVTVRGAGYRTTRYTVTLTGNKVLNFWNNVLDTVHAKPVEEGTDVKVTSNFLAGDIVKDGKINIYDLSAVVSYFGTEGLVENHPEYAKYDLNRDGVIDSKDVAYVLVSWDK